MHIEPDVVALVLGVGLLVQLIPVIVLAVRRKYRVLVTLAILSALSWPAAILLTLWTGLPVFLGLLLVPWWSFRSALRVPPKGLRGPPNEERNAL